MEYDNDRLRKHTPKMEVFYWVLLLLLAPMTNSLTIFPRSWWMWPVLLLLNGLLLPIYLVYSRTIVWTPKEK